MHREFVQRLRDDDKQVYLITGGFDCLIEPVAQELGIPMDHMFANKLFFQYNGTYATRLSCVVLSGGSYFIFYVRVHILSCSLMFNIGNTLN